MTQNLQPLAPTIGAQPVRKRTGRPPVLINCGRYGRLSVPQIAVVAGVTDAAIRARLRYGWKGGQLCQAVGARPNAKRGEIRVPTMLIAVQLAQRFRDRAPSAEEIRKFRPMSLSAASRWRQVIRAALEANGPRGAGDD